MIMLRRTLDSDFPQQQQQRQDYGSAAPPAAGEADLSTATNRRLRDLYLAQAQEASNASAALEVRRRELLGVAMRLQERTREPVVPPPGHFPSAFAPLNAARRSIGDLTHPSLSSTMSGLGYPLGHALPPTLPPTPFERYSLQNSLIAEPGLGFPVAHTSSLHELLVRQRLADQQRRMASALPEGRLDSFLPHDNPLLPSLHASPALNVAALRQIPLQEEVTPTISAAAVGSKNDEEEAKSETAAAPAILPEREPSPTVENHRSRVYIAELRNVDVLCGRGGRSNHHEGNKRFRELVTEMKEPYRKISSKMDKTDFSLKLVERIYSYGGRFVKVEKESGRFYIMSTIDARNKTSQALREERQLKWIG